MNELALFAGAGGGILGGKLLGWRTVCAVEYEAYPASVLVARQNDGLLEPFPVWDDVRTFDGKPWRGIVDVVSGGFPCQDISAAGKGAGINGERSGLWSEMARIIGEARPRFALVENSPVLTSRGLGTVLGDLSALGYDARWGVVSAADAGAPHKRERIWIVAHAPQLLGNGGDNNTRISVGTQQVSQSRNDGGAKDVAHAYGAQLKGNECANPGLRGWWETEPDVDRVANGVAARVDRLKAIGNGQVPQSLVLAWNILAREMS